MFSGCLLTIQTLSPDFVPGAIPGTGNRSVNETGSSQLDLILVVNLNVNLVEGNQTKSKTENFRDLMCPCVSVRVKIKLKVNEKGQRKPKSRVVSGE